MVRIPPRIHWNTDLPLLHRELTLGGSQNCDLKRFQNRQSIPVVAARAGAAHADDAFQRTAVEELASMRATTPRSACRRQQHRRAPTLIVGVAGESAFGGGGTLSAGKDFLWVRNSDDGGTEGILGGVSKFYPEENRWRHFTNADGFPMRGDSSLRTSCFYDNGNEIWMDDDINGGAFVYDGTKTKYFRTRQPDVQNEPLITYTRRVNTITEDAFGRVWCGTGYGIVVFTDALSGTDESMQVQGIEVFPNPASDFFTVHCPEGATITVRDVFGRIKTINDKVVDGKATISTEGFASGIYFVEIHDLNGRRNVSKVAINR